MKIKPLLAVKKISLRVRPGEQAELHVRAWAGGGFTWRLRHFAGGSRWLRLRAAAADALAMPQIGLVLCLTCALLALVWGLERFPAQVTVDELYPTLGAQELLAAHGRGPDGQFLPAFFNGASGPYSTGIGVYFRLLPALGTASLGAARGLTAGLTLASWVVLMLWARRAGRTDWPLLAPMLACTTLLLYFARTGSEAAQGAALAGLALGAYGLYLNGWPPGVWLAALAGGLALYAAPALRVSIPLAALILAVVDFNLHRARRRWSLPALATGLLLLTPLIRFEVTHPGALRAGSPPIWAGAENFGQALLALVENGVRIAGLPTWFFSGAAAEEGWFSGHALLPLWFLPLIGWGGWRLVRRWWQPDARLVLIGLAAAGCGLALIPFDPADLLPLAWLGALLAFGGVSAVLEGARTRWKWAAWRSGQTLLLAAVCLLALEPVFDLTAPSNHRAAAGQSYAYAGAVFADLRAYLAGQPEHSVAVSAAWGLDAEPYRRFFSPDLSEIRSQELQDFADRVRPDLETTAFVLSQAEYTQALESGKFESVAARPLAGTFVLAELRYSADIERLLAVEAARRHALTYTTLDLKGVPVLVGSSALDLGSAELLFDGNLTDPARTAESNPFTVTLAWQQPQTIRAVQVRVGSEAQRVQVILNPDDPAARAEAVVDLPIGQAVRDATLDFSSAQPVRALRIDVQDPSKSEPTHIHIWEISLISTP